MSKLMLSLDEIDRVMRINGITSQAELYDRTGVARKTWSKAFNSRGLSPAVMNALHELGARPSHLLVGVETDTPPTDD